MSARLVRGRLLDGRVAMHTATWWRGYIARTFTIAVRHLLEGP